MTTNPYAEAVEAGSVGLVEWLASPAEVQDLTPADWLQARKMSEAAVAAAVGPLLAPLREVHRVREVKAITDIDCVREDCDHEDESPTQPVETCAHCWDIAERIDMYFAESGIPEEVLWPCPTTQALDAIEAGATSEGGTR